MGKYTVALHFLDNDESVLPQLGAQNIFFLLKNKIYVKSYLLEFICIIIILWLELHLLYV